MKTSLLFSILCCLPFLTFTQKDIVQLEYFLNSDPGIGMATQVSISPTDSLVQSFTADISALSQGFHFLYTRVKDSDGDWSFLARRPFYISPTTVSTTKDVVQLEYFIDNDPGVGLANQVGISPTDSLIENFVVDLTSINEGFHFLYTRVKDSDGDWSFLSRRPFYISPMTVSTTKDVVQLEYFIDSDPGIGLANQVSISPTDSLIENFVADLISINEGFHFFYTRVKDSDGDWSFLARRPFYISPMTVSTTKDVVQLEYFIDSDPGIGLANQVGISPTDSLIENFVADLTSINEGFHFLYTRVKDSDGNWSLLARRPFYISPTDTRSKIVAAEYYFDSDPGFGSGTLISYMQDTIKFDTLDEGVIVPRDTTLATIIFEMDVSALSVGDHRAYVRVKDEEGNWSLISYEDFTLDECSDIGDVMLFGNTISVDVEYRATGEIETTSIIEPNTTVLMTAGDSIVMRVGFHTKAGSDFTAYVYPCQDVGSFAQLEQRNNSIAIEQNTLVKIMPNPVTDYVSVEFHLQENQEVMLSLYNNFGQQVRVFKKQHMIPKGKHLLQFDIATLPAGTYFLNIRGSEMNRSEKLLVVKD